MCIQFKDEHLIPKSIVEGSSRIVIIVLTIRQAASSRKGLSVAVVATIASMCDERCPTPRATIVTVFKMMYVTSMSSLVGSWPLPILPRSQLITAPIYSPYYASCGVYTLMDSNS